jgi:hypothetical protein
MLCHYVIIYTVCRVIIPCNQYICSLPAVNPICLESGSIWALQEGTSSQNSVLLQDLHGGDCCVNGISTGEESPTFRWVTVPSFSEWSRPKDLQKNVRRSSERWLTVYFSKWRKIKNDFNHELPASRGGKTFFHWGFCLFLFVFLLSHVKYFQGCACWHQVFCSVRHTY